VESILLKIKDLQKTQRYSTKELAKEIDVTAQTLYDYFSGKTQISIKNLQKIAGVFNVPISYFFEEKGNSHNISNIENSSLVHASGKSEVNIHSNNKQDKKSEKLKAELKECKKNNVIYFDHTENLIDNITELCVKISEEFPEVKSYLQEQREIRRFISLIGTMEAISDKKIPGNKKFFEYFDKQN
jgi:transcriptional regulator with XRE-family HTH domain